MNHDRADKNFSNEKLKLWYCKLRNEFRPEQIELNKYFKYLLFLFVLIFIGLPIGMLARARGNVSLMPTATAKIYMVLRAGYDPATYVCRGDGEVGANENARTSERSQSQKRGIAIRRLKSQIRSIKKALISSKYTVDLFHMFKHPRAITSYGT